jgi:parallel beta-helix repeat protein
VEENYVVDNGSAGIMSCGSRNLVIRDNVVLRNNRLHFLGKKRWEQAGIKCHLFQQGLIEGNYIAHNFDTYGIWLDNEFPDSRISQNVIHDNGRAGIFLEMSDYGFDRLLVDGNFIFDNHENAVYIHDASGATFVHNLLANTRDTENFGQAVYIRQVGPRTRTGNHTFVGNLLIGNARNVDVDYPAFRSSVQRFDYNLYDVSPEAQTFVINRDSDSPPPWSNDEFRALVSRDLASNRTSTANLKHSGKAAMTFADWKLFWQRHDAWNDGHSLCSEGNSVSYDPVTHELSIELSADPPEFPARKVADANLHPSKFQSGKSTQKIWGGLPILGAHELPPADWTR